MNSEVSVRSLKIISRYVLSCVNGGFCILLLSGEGMGVYWEDKGEKENVGEYNG